jgi:hypothetical protein
LSILTPRQEASQDVSTDLSTQSLSPPSPRRNVDPGGVNVRQLPPAPQVIPALEELWSSLFNHHLHLEETLKSLKTDIRVDGSLSDSKKVSYSNASSKAVAVESSPREPSHKYTLTSSWAYGSQPSPSHSSSATPRNMTPRNMNPRNMTPRSMHADEHPYFVNSYASYTQPRQAQPVHVWDGRYSSRAAFPSGGYWT